jgi:hypothetical protein
MTRSFLQDTILLYNQNKKGKNICFRQQSINSSYYNNKVSRCSRKMCVGGKGEMMEERVKPCRVKAKSFFIGTFFERGGSG